MKSVTTGNVTILDFNHVDIIVHLDEVMPILYSKVQTVYFAYRQCYSKDPTIKNTFKSTDAYTEALEKYCRKEDGRKIQEWVENHPNYADFFEMCWFIKKHSNHESPLEHLSFSVRITDVSRALTHQWVRSRIAAHSQQSQRYTSCTDDDTYVIPTEIDDNSDAKQIFTETIEYLEEQIKKLKELGIADEDIRYLYPNAFSSQIVTTMNLRNWIHFFNERCCSKAQTEIRLLAWKILNDFKILLPFILEDVGPKCYRIGKCPEAKPCPIEKSLNC